MKLIRTFLALLLLCTATATLAHGQSIKRTILGVTLGQPEADAVTALRASGHNVVKENDHQYAVNGKIYFGGEYWDRMTLTINKGRASYILLLTQRQYQNGLLNQLHTLLDNKYGRHRRTIADGDADSYTYIDGRTRIDTGLLRMGIDGCSLYLTYSDTALSGQSTSKPLGLHIPIERAVLNFHLGQTVSEVAQEAKRLGWELITNNTYRDPRGFIKLAGVEWGQIGFAFWGGRLMSIVLSTVRNIDTQYNRLRRTVMNDYDRKYLNTAQSSDNTLAFGDGTTAFGLIKQGVMLAMAFSDLAMNTAMEQAPAMPRTILGVKLAVDKQHALASFAKQGLAMHSDPSQPGAYTRESKYNPAHWCGIEWQQVSALFAGGRLAIVTFAGEFDNPDYTMSTLAAILGKQCGDRFQQTVNPNQMTGFDANTGITLTRNDNIIYLTFSDNQLSSNIAPSDSSIK